MIVFEIGVVFLSIIGGILFGGLIHESAHYVVLHAYGRDPAFHPPDVSQRQIRAAVEFNIPEEPIPKDIRLAAVAPVIVGVVISLPLLATGAMISRAGFAAAVAVIIWTAKPSRQDIEIASGSR